MKQFSGRPLLGGIVGHTNVYLKGAISMLQSKNYLPSLFNIYRGLDQQFEDFNPAVDVEENENEFLLSFDLPGINKEDVRIEINDQQLVVAGERKHEPKSDKNTRHFTERYHGSFQRVFTLPTHVDAGKIQAAYEQGVLSIVVPKSEAVKPRMIKIGDGKVGTLTAA